MNGGRASGTAAKSSIKGFDYQAPAALYVRKAARLKYMGFEHASLALRYANEELRPQQLLTCLIEVGDARFDVEKIRTLYTSPAYPLARRPEAKASA